jgi:hypothetical protein
MRAAAASEENQENDRANDGDEKRTEAAQAIREEGKHFPMIASALSAGFIILAAKRLARSRQNGEQSSW